MSDYQPGDLIDGKYRILSEIGGGAMGTVYRAEHELIHKQVGLKVLHSDVAANEEYVKRFRREAESAAHLEHPNICLVTDFGTLESGDSYLVMELLEGETLAQRMRVAGRMGTLESIRIIRQLLSALQCAGSMGIVHRDVKPDNIFLTEKNGIKDFVKLFDFGIAHDANPDGDMRTLTQAGQIYGTPQYISPEQICGEAVDPRADLYAAGVILYEMLMGRPPYYAENYIELLHMHIANEPPHLDKSIEASLPLDAIVQKLLKKKPDERFSTAAEVISALDEVLVTLSDNPIELAAIKAGDNFSVPAGPMLTAGMKTPSGVSSFGNETSNSVNDDHHALRNDHGAKATLASIKSDILSAMPKNKSQRRGLLILALFFTLAIIIFFIVLVLIIESEPAGQAVAHVDKDSGAVIYEMPAKHLKSPPQPYNYTAKFRISHDAVLIKDQNVSSAAENLLTKNTDAALVSLKTVKDKYKTHPNFQRLYLMALTSVNKSERDYDEIFVTFSQLLELVPDAGRNPYVGELIKDYLNSKEHNERMMNLLSLRCNAIGIGWLIIDSPYDRYRLRLDRLIQIYDKASGKDDVPKWLAAGVDIWRLDPKQCAERLKIVQNFDEKDEDFYQEIILRLDKSKLKECAANRFVKKDCNGCMRKYLKDRIEKHAKDKE